MGVAIAIFGLLTFLAFLVFFLIRCIMCTCCGKVRTPCFQTVFVCHVHMDAATALISVQSSWGMRRWSWLRMHDTCTALMSYCT